MFDVNIGRIDGCSLQRDQGEFLSFVAAAVADTAFAASRCACVAVLATTGPLATRG
jgi:hypothetical protein